MMKLDRWNPDDDETLSEATLREKLQKLGYRVSRYVYPPGTAFPTHSHDVNKVDAVLSGEFRITMDGESVVLGADDSVQVPRGADDSAEVIGDPAVVSLDGVKS